MNQTKRERAPARDAGQGRTVLRMHREFYSADAIRETVAAFSDHTKAEFTPGRDYHRVTLLVDDGRERERLADEFLNYALFRTVASRKK